MIKDQIRAAQIVLPCAELNQTMGFFTEQLGFLVEMIYPADAPQVAVISGYGVTLRLETSAAKLPLVLRLSGGFSAHPSDMPSEIYSPDGVRIIFAAEQSAIAMPPPVQELIVTRGSENSWSAGRAGMQYRDLIPGRLGERFVASNISIPEGGEIPDYVHFHKIRFQMIYCLRGWAKLVYQNQGEPFLMNAGDCLLQPPEIRHRVLESSPKFEVLEIGSPAIHETFADHALALPNELFAPDTTFGGGQRFLRHIAAQAVWCGGQRPGIETRDTGIAAASGGVADVRLIRATADAQLPVNHGGEFLFFYLIKGSLRLGGETITDYDLNANDCLVLPSGARYLIELKKGLEMLRVTLPANNF